MAIAGAFSFVFVGLLNTAGKKIKAEFCHCLDEVRGLSSLSHLGADPKAQ